MKREAIRKPRTPTTRVAMSDANTWSIGSPASSCAADPACGFAALPRAGVAIYLHGVSPSAVLARRARSGLALGYRCACINLSSRLAGWPTEAGYVVPQLSASTSSHAIPTNVQDRPFPTLAGIPAPPGPRHRGDSGALHPDTIGPNGAPQLPMPRYQLDAPGECRAHPAPQNYSGPVRMYDDVLHFAPSSPRIRIRSDRAGISM